MGKNRVSTCVYLHLDIFLAKITVFLSAQQIWHNSQTTKPCRHFSHIQCSGFSVLWDVCQSRIKTLIPQCLWGYFSEYKQTRKKKPFSLTILKSINKRANVLKLVLFTLLPYFKNLLLKSSSNSVFYIRKNSRIPFSTYIMKKIRKLIMWNDKIQGHCLWKHHAAKPHEISNHDSKHS